jgi:hypothetical protein
METASGQNVSNMDFALCLTLDILASNLDR